jgi:hypothetical protein
MIPGMVQSEPDMAPRILCGKPLAASATVAADEWPTLSDGLTNFLSIHATNPLIAKATSEFPSQ